ncbi:unnamed protein product [Coffea canephora]|uniref:Protein DETOXIFICATION n=1 Tax=Coffea canephora TaxID=49390 RepID=A0A068U9M8_COFCA|nr:unnamed protein product [Coffea canephora]
MCKQLTTSSPPPPPPPPRPSKCDSDQRYLLPIHQVPAEGDIFSPLIPKNPTSSKHHQNQEQQPPQPNQIVKPHKHNHDTHISSSVLKEATSVANIALPMILTGLLLYSRSMISMLFLGRLGDLALAGGSLALGFANISGYSILSGLAMGMEPICGQAFGAKRYTLLGLSLQRTVLLLMLTSLPIALLWVNMKTILLFFGQDQAIAREAQSYLMYTLPDLFAQSLLHPLRIYLRAQSITLPLTFCAALSILLHIPINYFLVTKLSLGIKGVALSGVWTNFNLVASLIIYILISGVYKKTWGGLTTECLKGWQSLLYLSIPSSTVASMGILIQTTSLIYIFPSSLSFSVSTRVGNELGARQPAKAKLAAVVGLCCSFVLGFSALMFAVSMRHVWARMFTADNEIIALTSLVLPIIGLCELGNCPQTTGCGVLRGTARPRVGANINLGCFYLVGMPVAVGLGFYAGFDFEGLWMGLLAAQASCMVSMLVVLYLTDWEFEAQRAKELTSAGADAAVEKIEEEDKPLIAENKDTSLC